LVMWIYSDELARRFLPVLTNTDNTVMTRMTVLSIWR
jgi:hypothetical protein